MKQDSTLAEVKVYLRENCEKGIDCPACGRVVKIYKYTMNSGMAFALITMYKLTQANPNENYFHVQKDFAEKFGTNANALHYSLMKWWGFMLPQPNTDPDRKGTGYWCLTEKGKRFVLGQLSTPRQVHIYDNKCVGYSEEHTNIHQALQDKFDFKELMGQYFENVDKNLKLGL